MPSKKDAAWWRDYRARKARNATPVATPATPSVADAVAANDAAQVEVAGGVMVAPAARVSSGPKPSFLAAPVDDCACGHDRHSQHDGTTGACKVYVGRARCPCPGFFAGF